MDGSTVFKIVKASGVKANELVLVHFWGEAEDLHLADSFMTAVASLGASPVLLHQSRSRNREMFTAARESCFDKKYFALFSGFDAVLDVFTYRPVVLGSKIPDEQNELYRSYMGKLFSALLGSTRFTQIRVPTAANAEESGHSPDDYISRMNSAYDIDYDELRKNCEAETEKYKSARCLAVHSGDGCILHLKLNDREWHIDSGEGDMPCGEVYIAPVESETNGDVYFDELYFDGKSYGSVTLKVKDGEVVSSSSPELQSAFDELSHENKIVCELGIGLNPNVKDLCGYTVLDEKRHGSFHIAIGANDMFGGENKADDHIDMVGIGRIEVLT